VAALSEELIWATPSYSTKAKESLKTAKCPRIDLANSAQPCLRLRRPAKYLSSGSLMCNRQWTLRVLSKWRNKVAARAGKKATSTTRRVSFLRLPSELTHLLSATLQLGSATTCTSVSRVTSKASFRLFRAAGHNPTPISSYSSKTVAAISDWILLTASFCPHQGLKVLPSLKTYSRSIAARRRHSML